MNMFQKPVGIALLVVMAGCVVNPVTGQRELGWLTTGQQVSIGEQQYAPAQQMQGGQYVVDPALSEYVDGVGRRVASVSGIDLPYQFVVLNNSIPNAWALPGGKIAINRGLLTELKNEAELAAVLGHEVVHAAARHGAQRMERDLLLQGAVAVTALSVGGSGYANTVIGSAQTAAQLLTLKYGRDAERESDYYGTLFMAQAGYDPQAAVTLQETFVRLSQGEQGDWKQGLFSSHPPSTERVANNRAHVARLRADGFQGGDYGAERFQTALRQLREDADAYSAYEYALDDFAADELEDAAANVQRAISAQAGESAFHALRGDIRLKQKRYDDAVINYDRAIARYDQMYSYFLHRGMAHTKLHDADAAKRDLTRSIQLLPTALAYNELGKLAESEGNADAAVRYYEAASGGASELGRSARANLLRLDVPRQPAKYVRAVVTRENTGRVVMRVTNLTSVDLTNVRVQVELAWGSNNRRYAPMVEHLAADSVQLVLVAEDVPLLSSVSAYTVAADVVD
jgi:predicted Zn-dependent protease